MPHSLTALISVDIAPFHCGIIRAFFGDLGMGISEADMAKAYFRLGLKMSTTFHVILLVGS